MKTWNVQMLKKMLNYVFLGVVENLLLLLIVAIKHHRFENATSWIAVRVAVHKADAELC